MAYFGVAVESCLAYSGSGSAELACDLNGGIASAGLDTRNEALALLCMYAQSDQFSTLCESLCRRLEAMGDAVLCYFV
ncbi:hypothetical protein GGF42_000084 [Coemansia sp. RSA 2424]|nr:hypothetical protein GGF42_000084 [Coemansia sp. RSA 2424]